jgi:hypothetical protein
MVLVAVELAVLLEPLELGWLPGLVVLPVPASWLPLRHNLRKLQCQVDFRVHTVGKLHRPGQQLVA